MKKVLTMMAVLVLVAAVAVPSFAYRGWRGHGDGPCGDITKYPGLNLTVDQKAKLTEMRTAHLKDIKPLQDKLFSKKGDLRLLWQEKNLDQAKITALDKEVRVLRDQIHDKRTSYQWAVYKLLTPEQREQFKGFGPGGACSGPGMGPGMGHGMGPGNGPGHGPGHGPGMMMGPAAD
ncbi:Heavy-metal resistance [Syntrophus gentianae]|uniref:Heavy-metal resistance n=1 Tax=Syntrophus gentianae TaxID=43775 RepID=A0A1H7UXW7_9BACT|nr:Spy/CpxP family protein refolding chaperone [Syntrophus gentianae]SEM01800.1 Heavy-metal resistance [Syntrophus gentianae]